MKIIETIYNANPNRSVSELSRRIIKLAEEIGELSEAYLSVSSETNYKNKTWSDVREEATDAIIVALDVFLTDMPEDKNKSFEDKVHLLNEIINRKVEKWIKSDSD